MKISYCTTCSNRLEDLLLTLPWNLHETKGENVEFCLVNYNSQDSLDSWIRTNFMDQIESGRLVYGHEQTADQFHMSKAKNLAHRLASGDILMNLDADNYVANATAILLAHFSEQPQSILHLWSGHWFDGTSGRLALPAKMFDLLGGYDEDFAPICYEEQDLMQRASAMGIPVIALPPLFRSASVDVTKATRWECEKANQQRSTANLLAGRLVANPNGWGKADMTINFGCGGGESNPGIVVGNDMFYH